jgi:hypothetical protein
MKNTTFFLAFFMLILTLLTAQIIEVPVFQFELPNGNIKKSWVLIILLIIYYSFVMVLVYSDNLTSKIREFIFTVSFLFILIRYTNYVLEMREPVHLFIYLILGVITISVLAYRLLSKNTIPIERLEIMYVIGIIFVSFIPNAYHQTVLFLIAPLIGILLGNILSRIHVFKQQEMKIFLR